MRPSGVLKFEVLARWRLIKGWGLKRILGAGGAGGIGEGGWLGGGGSDFILHPSIGGRGEASAY